MATRIKKNDTVVVRTGKDKGKEGKVIFVSNNMVIVEVINIAKRHTSSSIIFGGDLNMRNDEMININK